MSARIILKVRNGPLKDKKFVVEEKTTCIVGRGKGCSVFIPEGLDNKISRHHCLLEVDPPNITLWDLGSKNGTYTREPLGGDSQGRRKYKFEKLPNTGLKAKDGDEVLIGETLFEIISRCPAHCSLCNVEIAFDALANAQLRSGVFLCEECFNQDTSMEDGETLIGDTVRLCEECGDEIGFDALPGDPDDGLCFKCRKVFPETTHEDTETVNLKTLPSNHYGIQKYKIIKQLGSGGVALVYLVRDVRDNEEMAMKVILPQVALDKRVTDNFIREIDNTKSLSHPNIIKLFDTGYFNGTFYFTMEYCDGGSLIDYMFARDSALSIEEAMPIINQVLDALEYSHQAEIPNVRHKDGHIRGGKGLVHRDIKPSNVLLIGKGSSPTVKIADFGLSKVFGSAGMSGITRTGMISGTPTFVCRQQLLEYKYAKPEVDVWATAALMYFLLTRHCPREFKESKRSPVASVLHSAPVPILNRNPDIPKDLAKLLDRALNDSRELHFKSAADFQKALNDCVG